VLAAVIAVHAVLAFALMHLSGTVDLIPEQADLQIFDINAPEPPPPVIIRQVREKAPEKEGEASPPNLKSEATPVVRPKPRIEVPAPPVIVASPTPNQGAAPTQGAAPVPGPGTGAGGVGTGTGSGGSGSGPGGGGGQASSATLVRGITNRDFPAQIQRSWPRGGAIFIRLRIQPDGRPSQCDVMRGFGDRAADQWTCSLIMERGRFRPARDSNGNPVAAWYGYIQRDTGRLDR
jgi:protein TonB